MSAYIIEAAAGIGFCDEDMSGQPGTHFLIELELPREPAPPWTEVPWLES